jgi:hypothetical protein
MIQLYLCEICKTPYNNPTDAQTCESNKPIPLFSPGDIVTCGPCYGWYDGEEDWISNLKEIKEMRSKHRGLSQPRHGNCFGSCCNYLFYHVVTAVTPYNHDDHKLTYHLASLAIKPRSLIDDKLRLKGGWTAVETHYTPTLVKNPPESVLKTSKPLIGEIFDNLL